MLRSQSNYALNMKVALGSANLLNCQIYSKLLVFYTARRVCVRWGPSTEFCL